MKDDAIVCRFPMKLAPYKVSNINTIFDIECFLNVLQESVDWIFTPSEKYIINIKPYN